MSREPLNQWDARFQAENYVYGTEPNEFLREIEPRIKRKGSLLSIAEGEGRNSVFLAKKGYTVTAWDYAPSGLAKIKKLAEQNHVEVKTELVDLSEVNWAPDQWDQIVCIFGHFPPEVRRRTLEGVKRAIKPGGLYISEVYSHYQLPYQSGGPKEVSFLYRPEDFLHTFADWKILHFFLGEVTRKEGELHNGLSHVIQFMGRKPE